NCLIALTHFCEDHGPSVVLCMQVMQQLPSSSRQLLEVAPTPPSPARAEETLLTQQQPPPASVCFPVVACPSCRSMPPNILAMHTEDASAGVHLVSSQHPTWPSQLYSRLRQACLRVHSCEVCPTSAMYFGDPVNGHVMGSPFQLDDAKARGLTSQYAVVVMSTDSRMLLQAWPWLVAQIGRISGALKQMATAQFQAEQLRQGSAKATRINGSSWLRMRRSDNPARSLAQLTGDPAVFKRLHLWFSWMLRGWQREEIRVGRPTEDELVEELQMMAADQDCLLDSEDSEDEGTRTVVPTPTAPTVCKPAGGNAVVSIVFHSLRHIRQRLKRVPVTNLIDRSVSVLDPDSPQLSLHRQPHIFLLLLYHLVTGNQIVFRTNLPALAASFFKLMRQILPHNCVQEVLNSSVYEEPYRCNFLGLAWEAVIPDIVLTDPVSHPMLVLECRADLRSLAAESFASVDDLAVSCATNCPVPSSAYNSLLGLPGLIDELDKLLDSQQLPDEALDLLVTNVKEDWLNRARQFFTCCYVQGAQQQQLSNAQVSELLDSLGCSRNDELVLKFWTRGLAATSRREIQGLGGKVGSR
ncbi:hypothetical protein BOX15_Mlig027378g5, partial [Macrostomum lignano]